MANLKFVEPIQAQEMTPTAALHVTLFRVETMVDAVARDLDMSTHPQIKRWNVRYDESTTRLAVLLLVKAFGKLASVAQLLFDNSIIVEPHVSSRILFAFDQLMDVGMRQGRGDPLHNVMPTGLSHELKVIEKAYSRARHHRMWDFNDEIDMIDTSLDQALFGVKRLTLVVCHLLSLTKEMIGDRILAGAKLDHDIVHATEIDVKQEAVATGGE